MQKISYKLIFYVAVALTVVTSHAVQAQMTNEEKMQQVYGAFYPDLTTEHITWLNSCLDRCSVIELPLTATTAEGIGAIAELELLTKYGASLTPDSMYDAGTFNPLKYAINFKKGLDQYFRISNTVYVLKVEKE